MPNGIPSHDTFNRFFSALDPDEFEQAFLSWIKDISELTDGDIVSIDGKTICGSRDGDSKRAVHMVSAWSKANQLSLGQIKVDEKSNEITAIPKLLDVLVLKGCLVTIDAMGCQRDIAARIIEKEADYLLAVKGNQGCLEENAEMIGKGVRSHWGIENNLHWQLDVSFNEDDSRKRDGYAAQNFPY